MLRQLHSKVSSSYAKLLDRQKAEQNFPGPVQNLRWYNSFTSYFRNEVVLRMCTDEGVNRILVVGDGGGRDYWYLCWKGYHDVTSMDIAPQSEVPGLIQHDLAADTMPFEPHSFDCIIACDVLEHLYDDVKALKNIGYLLKEQGLLIISGPNWHDVDRTHVRLHSPVIIRRMLEDNGFTIEEQLARGGITQIYMRWLHPLNIVANILLFSLFKKSIFQFVNKFLYRLNYSLVQWPRLPYLEYRLFGRGDGLNGYIIKAKKTEAKDADIKALCQEKFADMMP